MTRANDTYTTVYTILNTHYEGESDIKASVIDLLSDLKHFCFIRNISFEQCLFMAGLHFQAETQPMVKRSPTRLSTLSNPEE